MNTPQLEKIYQDFLRIPHHTFLIRTNSRERVFNYFKEEFRDKENFCLNLQVFDIEKSREFTQYAKTHFESEHYLLISFFSINHEAENVLLKLLEEAAESLKILLIIDTSTKLLSTTSSRVYNLDSLILEDKDKSLDTLVQKFLITSPATRMNLVEIKDLLSKQDSFALQYEAKSRTDRESVEKFLDNLYRTLFQSYQELLTKEVKVEEKDKYLEYLDDVTLALKYIKSNSSSSKTILEYLSLKLPGLKN